MEGRTHERDRRAARTALAATLLLALLPGAPVAAATGADAVPDCTAADPGRAADDAVVTPWQTVLDGEGVVTEHRLVLRREGVDLTLRTGRRGFSLPVEDGLLLIGERSAGATTLTMVDTQSACRVWSRKLDGFAYETDPSGEPGELRLAVHDATTRELQGDLLLDVDSGATVAMIDGQCSTTCEPNDGELIPADFLPAGAPRQVPAFPAGAWPKDTVLPFAWLDGALPPDWARTPITTGAAEASDTTLARSPRFVHRSGAADTVRYTSSFPTFCRYGIACASRNMPVSWLVWLRPHGTDFSWGTLRWCQKDDSAGCFDLRRVLIHELGHITGLDHPSREGFNLEANETVMHAITPAKPSAGSTRHAFGRCDVATLQELYDLPGSTTPVSTCNDVATELALGASAASVLPGTTVRLRADLKIAPLSSVGRLAGNALNGRSVKLRYRRAGSSDAWTTLWMEPLVNGGYSLTIAPQATWEYQAVFPAPVAEGLRASTSATLKVRVGR